MKQKTLKKTYYFEGRGLHTGTYSHIAVHPAPEGHGIRFRRTDLAGRPEIEALAPNVSNTARSTTISQDDAVVVTIEHILSAFTGLGVDNALVDINNVEVPILDGSAKPYVDAIVPDGLRIQKEDRRCLTVSKTVEIRDERRGSWIRIEPAAEPSMDVTVDFNSRIVGVQKVHWDLRTDYASQFAPCRTFVFFHEIEYLYRNNLIKGGDMDNAIVIVERPVGREQLDSISRLFGVQDLSITEAGYLSNLSLRFPDECGRHKLLDLLGDMRLIGGFASARVTAFKPGHAINTRAAKELFATIE